MGEASSSAEVLISAMARLSVRASPVAWNRSALGKPTSSSYLRLDFTGAPSTIQVHIQWKPILLDAVRTLGGTEPIYSSAETANYMFQARVSFKLPLDRNGTTSTDIDVVGTKCFTLFEAESEASAGALQELQRGSLSIHVMDVSRTRSGELGKRCREILANASELHHGIKSVLLDWENSMDRAERFYRPMHGDASPAAAEYLLKLMAANYLKLKELSSETEKVELNVEALYDRVEYLCCSQSTQEANAHHGRPPLELKLRMKLVIEEMIKTLGWPAPVYKSVYPQPNVYICEATLFLGNGTAGSRIRKLTVAGSEASTEEEALESSCKAAISLMESKEAICLVDLNYNHRSAGELCVIEAEQTLQFAVSTRSKVLCEWESMVNKLQACENHCLKAAAGYQREEQGESAQHMKLNNVKAITALHKTCLADLEAVKWRLNNTISPMNE